MISAVSSMIAADRSVSLRASARLSALAFGACALLAPAVAHAAEPTQAETLFREGRVLLDQKKYDEACPKLAESQKLEPGAGTLLALALCHEGQGKPATASLELKKASELGRQKGRNDLAAAADKKAAALEASVPHLVVHLPEGAAYRVRCDGEPIAENELGAPVPMDPGEHRVEVSAPGKTARSYVVRISGPGTTEIVVDKLEDAAAAKPPREAAHAVVTTPDPAPAEKDTKEENPGGAQRTVGLIIIGVGVVGLGAGAYFGGKALSESGEANRTCPTTTSCPDDGNDANERSKSSFRTAVIGLAAGTVAVTAGAIVYFLAPDKNEKKSKDAKAPPQRTAHVIPSAGPNGVSLGVIGTF